MQTEPHLPVFPKAMGSVSPTGKFQATSSRALSIETCDLRASAISISRMQNSAPTTRRPGPTGPSGTRGSSPNPAAATSPNGCARDCRAGPMPRVALRTALATAHASAGVQSKSSSTWRSFTRAYVIRGRRPVSPGLQHCADAVDARGRERERDGRRPWRVCEPRVVEGHVSLQGIPRAGSGLHMLVRHQLAERHLARGGRCCCGDRLIPDSPGRRGEDQGVGASAGGRTSSRRRRRARTQPRVRGWHRESARRRSSTCKGGWPGASSGSPGACRNRGSAPGGRPRAMAMDAVNT